MHKPAILALENGTIFHGLALGHEGESIGEVVFNTSMTGYQEIISDPSYAKQLITLTYPHIGNIGTNDQDNEARQPFCAGLVIRDLPRLHSNWRSSDDLHTYMAKHQIVGIWDIDTRHLTHILREQGALGACIVSGDNINEAEAVAKAKSFAGLNNMDLAKEVTTEKPYTWHEGSWQEDNSYPVLSDEQLPLHVVVYDFGVKHNILRLLVDRGCRLTVVPAKTPASDVLDMNPDGVFLSNGPGDPAPCDYAIDAIKTFLEHDMPLFGICLGHQLLALACGANTVKMKFGHHGANHPVQDLENKAVMITSQNHGFAVQDDNLPQHLTVTHRSLFDNSIQGISHKHKQAYGFQGHPEASPGPHDILSIFDRFIAFMSTEEQAEQAKQQTTNTCDVG